MSIPCSGLDEFVTFVDEVCLGNLRDPRVDQRYAPFNLLLETKVDGTRLKNINSQALKLGHAAADQGDPAFTPRNFHSQIGSLTTRSSIGPVMRTHRLHDGGFLCFGPYVPLRAGSHVVTFLASLVQAGTDSDAYGSSSLTVDIISGSGSVTHKKQIIHLDSRDKHRLVELRFELGSDVEQVEARAHVGDRNAIWEISLPEFGQPSSIR